jgi:hypothetical protein
MMVFAVPLMMLIMGIAGVAMGANNSSYYDQNEGGILGLLVFFYLVGVVLVFLVLPQSKERKMVPTLIAVGIAVAVVTVIFGLIDLAVYVSGVNFAFWTEWFTLSNMGALAIALGWFFILFATLLAVYKIRDHKEELMALELGIIGFLFWAVFFLVAYYVLQWDFLLG